MEDQSCLRGCYMVNEHSIFRRTPVVSENPCSFYHSIDMESPDGSSKTAA